MMHLLVFIFYFLKSEQVIQIFNIVLYKEFLKYKELCLYFEHFKYRRRWTGFGGLWGGEWGREQSHRFYNCFVLFCKNVKYFLSLKK